MSLYILIVFITVITCNDTIISPCDKDNNQIVFVNKTAQVFKCINCNEGYFSYYDSITKQIQCKQCDDGFVNEGNAISFLSIYHSFLNKEYIKKYITATCEAKDYDNNEMPCIPFNTDYKGNAVYSGNPIGINKVVKYKTRLIIHYTSLNGKSTLTFKCNMNYEGRNDMKIYVNEIPKKPEKCLFCKKKDGHMYCKISDNLCKLSRGGNCNKLRVPILNN